MLAILDENRDTGPLVRPRGQSSTSETLGESAIEAVADRLESKFSVDGPLTTEEIEDVVRDSAESLDDAPVQSVVPLLAEHKASTRLRELSGNAGKIQTAVRAHMPIGWCRAETQ